jgi:hypothetical protein
MAAGARLTRSVELDNTTRSIVDVSVYPAAASIVRGRFAFAPARDGNDLSSWTSVSHELVRLAPGTKAFDTLTIIVPVGAQSGERYGVLWAQVSTTPAAGGGVTLVNRVGIRMYLSIGPIGGSPSGFTIGPLSAGRSRSGQPFVAANVHNTGKSTLDMSGSLTLSDGPDGLRAGPFVATVGAIVAPGVFEPVTVHLLANLPRGPWQADLSLASGALHHSAVGRISFPPIAAASNSPAAFPTLLLLETVLLVVLAGVAFALLVSRRRVTRMTMLGRLAGEQPLSERAIEVPMQDRDEIDESIRTGGQLSCPCDEDRRDQPDPVLDFWRVCARRSANANPVRAGGGER